MKLKDFELKFAEAITASNLLLEGETIDKPISTVDGETGFATKMEFTIFSNEGRIKIIEVVKKGEAFETKIIKLYETLKADNSIIETLENYYLAENVMKATNKEVIDYFSNIVVDVSKMFSVGNRRVSVIVPDEEIKTIDYGLVYKEIELQKLASKELIELHTETIIPDPIVEIDELAIIDGLRIALPEKIAELEKQATSIISIEDQKIKITKYRK